ncbi:Hypothetical predicted protein [Mytilus galloprovincialis]|uniref:Uncharacterized protein n=1 Tax=Mytilus galloprovincialis TaxID=29158 RepID=A0A8B6E341_MYTGA|nr:Hypothetical predicted protein [Mytilus galloprovincialis]
MSIKVKWEGQCTEDVMVLQGIQQDNGINITNETNHLGIKRNEQNRANISERIRTGRATIYSLLGAGLHVRRGFSPMVAYKLWRTHAVPRSIYGLEVMYLLAKEKDMLELAERKILRQIQGLPNNTANMAVYTLVGAEPIAITLDKNVLTFFMNIVRNSGTIECEILRRQIVFSDQRGKDLINRVEKTLSKYNLKSNSYYT